MVLASLVGSLLIALVKFAAASISGSSAMLSEGVHSLADTINEALLLLGISRASRRPDQSHPLGYGRELYFWSFIVSLLVLALGAGVSLYEGYSELHHPGPLRAPGLDLAVLGISLLCELASGWLGFKAFRAEQGDQGYFGTFHASKDPSIFVVAFGDAAAIVGLFIAAVGVSAAHVLRMPELDAVASVGIGLLLTATAILMARETKDLLIGEAARPEVRDSILQLAGADPDVCHANGVITIQMGPDQIFAALSIDFRDGLNTDGIEACVGRIEAAIKQVHPEVGTLFVKPQTMQAWQLRMAQRAADLAASSA